MIVAMMIDRITKEAEGLETSRTVIEMVEVKMILDPMLIMMHLLNRFLSDETRVHLNLPHPSPSKTSIK